MYKQPTHYDPNTNQYLHVYGQQRYEYGINGGSIVVDALVCESINQPQPKVTVYYNPLQSVKPFLTFRRTTC